MEVRVWREGLGWGGVGKMSSGDQVSHSLKAERNREGVDGREKACEG
jgi:hypothetical protein